MLLAIAFAGKIGSGKTEITTALAKALDWPRASFGDYVRHMVRERGLEQTRENLQVVGTELLRQSPREFCRAVLLFSGWRPGANLLIDGLRHSETVGILTVLVAPARLKIVFLAISEATSAQRLQHREGWNQGAIANVESHSSESQVSSVIRNLADVEINGERSVEQVKGEILEWIQNQQGN